jgi:hypothetical protein
MQWRTRLSHLALAGLLVALAAGSSAACSGGSAPVGGGAMGSGDGMNEVNAMGYMVHTDHVADPATVLPAYATGTPELARLYTFAMRHPEVLTYMPCTCGCGPMGHNSNWNCYIRTIEADGTVVFDEHAVNCQVCQDITSDVIRLWQRGSPLSEIRDTIDATYPGPQTPTDYPAGM